MTCVRCEFVCELKKADQNADLSSLTQIAEVLEFGLQTMGESQATRGGYETLSKDRFPLRKGGAIVANWGFPLSCTTANRLRNHDASPPWLDPWFEIGCFVWLTIG